MRIEVNKSVNNNRIYVKENISKKDIVNIRQPTKYKVTFKNNIIINGFKNNQVITAPTGSAIPDKKVYKNDMLRVKIS